MLTKRTIQYLMATVLLLPGALGALELDSVTYDPAIIASGDTVDIIVQYRHTIEQSDEDRVNDPDWRFEARLEPDDSLTDKYVTIEDAVGNNVRGSVLAGNYYNKVFRVKVHANAPAGEYEFRLIGDWYRNGVAQGDSRYVLIRMPVKKEGIVLDIGSYATTPSDVRPGDNYVEVRSFIENTGEKRAEAVEVTLVLPEGIDASYTDANRRWIGLIGPGESKELVSFVDIDEDLEPGAYEIGYRFGYKDEDQNRYSSTQEVPFLVRRTPRLSVVSSDGVGAAGATGQLSITVRNDGSESAESIDVRLLKDSAQPFRFDIRSHYLGELGPGEEGTVLFDISTDRGSEPRLHDMTVLLRAKGDSDEGDDNIYTWTDNARYRVEGTATNYLLWIGALAAIVVLLVLGVTRARRKR